MAYGKRCARLFPGAALAVTAALAAAGCTSTAASAGSGTAGTAPALTAAQARQVFDSYVATSGQAARAGDATLALSDVTGVQHAVVAATVKIDSYFSGNSSGGQAAYSSSLSVSPPYGQYAYGMPTFYLPRQAGYPRFFVADATQTLKGMSPANATTTWAGGAQVPAGGRALMVFEQASGTAPWLLASISAPPAGATLPKLATDSTGHVPTVPLDTATLLARPDVVGPLQAAVVDDGPASAAAKAVASGPLTTGMYQGARTSVLGLKAPPGDVYQWELEGSHYPEFALRTAGGGALVFYSMYLNTTVAVPAAVDNSAVKPGPAIAVPAYVAALLPPGEPAPRVSLEAQQVLSFAAVDPPSGNGKIQVIAIGGGPDYATAS